MVNTYFHYSIYLHNLVHNNTVHSCDHIRHPCEEDYTGKLFGICSHSNQQHNLQSIKSKLMQLLGIKMAKEISCRVGQKTKQVPFIIQLLNERRYYLKIIDR